MKGPTENISWWIRGGSSWVFGGIVVRCSHRFPGKDLVMLDVTRNSWQP